VVRPRRQGIPILNEIGEDPGLDHMGVMQTLDAIRDEGGRALSVTSYGAGLPAFEHNRNPLGYKFSWSPKGVMLAAQAPAAYLRQGRRVEVRPSVRASLDRRNRGDRRVRDVSEP
jgi:saccharopine dehydrogenase-like NADP-dependent oxidoreductase